jgi:hypothetical protein
MVKFCPALFVPATDDRHRASPRSPAPVLSLTAARRSGWIVFTAVIGMFLAWLALPLLNALV